MEGLPCVVVGVIDAVVFCFLLVDVVVAVGVVAPVVVIVVVVVVVVVAVSACCLQFLFDRLGRLSSNSFEHVMKMDIVVDVVFFVGYCFCCRC